MIVAYFQRGKLPLQKDILPELMSDPIQTPTTKVPFQYSQKGVNYTIKPQYNYEIYGLVVAQNDNEVWYSRFKKLDPTNTKDFCVVWGKNITSDVYRVADFKSEEFVCQINFKTENPINRSYSNENLSNNHLLTANESVYQAIRSAYIGDQIKVKGYLVSYDSVTADGQRGSRGTSVSRTDEGMGACETIYVEDFQVLKEGNVIWRDIFKKCPYPIIGSAGLLVILFFISILLSGFSKPGKPPEMPNKDLLIYNPDKKIDRP